MKKKKKEKKKKKKKKSRFRSTQNKNFMRLVQPRLSMDISAGVAKIDLPPSVLNQGKNENPFEAYVCDEYSKAFLEHVEKKTNRIRKLKIEDRMWIRMMKSLGEEFNEDEKRKVILLKIMETFRKRTEDENYPILMTLQKYVDYIQRWFVKMFSRSDSSFGSVSPLIHIAESVNGLVDQIFEQYDGFDGRKKGLLDRSNFPINQFRHFVSEYITSKCGAKFIQYLERFFVPNKKHIRIMKLREVFQLDRISVLFKDKLLVLPNTATPSLPYERAIEVLSQLSRKSISGITTTGLEKVILRTYEAVFATLDENRIALIQDTDLSLVLTYVILNCDICKVTAWMEYIRIFRVFKSRKSLVVKKEEEETTNDQVIIDLFLRVSKWMRNEVEVSIVSEEKDKSRMFTKYVSAEDQLRIIQLEKEEEEKVMLVRKKQQQILDEIRREKEEQELLSKKKQEVVIVDDDDDNGIASIGDEIDLEEYGEMLMTPVIQKVSEDEMFTLPPEQQTKESVKEPDLDEHHHQQQQQQQQELEKMKKEVRKVRNEMRMERATFVKKAKFWKDKRARIKEKYQKKLDEIREVHKSQMEDMKKKKKKLEEEEEGEEDDDKIKLKKAMKIISELRNEILKSKEKKKVIKEEEEEEEEGTSHLDHKNKNEGVIEFQKIQIKTLEEEIDREKQRFRKLHKEVNLSRRKLFRIDHKEVQIGREIARGGCGIIYEGQYSIQRNIAIKTLKLKNHTKEERSLLLKEVQDQIALIHPNILRVYGYSDPPGLPGEREVWILMELMDCNLKEYIRNKNPRLTVSEKIDIIRKITTSIHFCHTRDPSVIHNDIKSANFLVRDDGKEIKLCDFGLVKKSLYNYDFVASSRREGTIFWMAPELFKQNPVTTIYSDIYALGITIWEILFERFPYSRIKNKEDIVKNVCSKTTKLRPDISADSGLPKLLKKLMRRLWHHKPKKRMDTGRILKWLDENEFLIKCECGKMVFPKEI